MMKLSKSFFGEEVVAALQTAPRTVRALLMRTAMAIVAITWATVAHAQTGTTLDKISFSTLPGDRVQVGLSPYDPTHGFITFRLREGQSAPG